MLTFLDHPGDWPYALRGALQASLATTNQGSVHATVTDVHLVQVRGAVAALAFAARVSDSAVPTAARELDTADLLAALPDGTEVHVFCSGPAGSLPPDYIDGVDSVTLG